MPDRVGGPALPPFARRLIDWQTTQGRHDLPWQRTTDPWRIWLSEIMLQQTQVSTVLPYYERFLATFPDIAALAAAPIDEVLRLWSGLGYYARARNLHRAAVRIVAEHGGAMPDSRLLIEQLPGIGRSTAAAIATFAFGAREAILDGNVKRVFARHRMVEGDPASSAVLARLWAIAEAELPHEDLEAYTQGLMDLGATLCTRARPACERCPVADDCAAHRQGRAAEFPTPRVRRAQPVRGVQMLLACRGDEVLLERRPDTGIWGGLWSLPEVAIGDDPREVLLARVGLRASRIEALERLRHTFTHFALDIDPVRMDVRASRAPLPPGLIWMDLAEAIAAAVPTPVRQLLQGLATDG
jgi:A/G-specific adenine glycosylase